MAFACIFLILNYDIVPPKMNFIIFCLVLFSACENLVLTKSVPPNQVQSNGLKSILAQQTVKQTPLPSTTSSPTTPLPTTQPPTTQPPTTQPPTTQPPTTQPHPPPPPPPPPQLPPPSQPLPKWYIIKGQEETKWSVVNGLESVYWYGHNLIQMRAKSSLLTTDHKVGIQFVNYVQTADLYIALSLLDVNGNTVCSSTSVYVYHGADVQDHELELKKCAFSRIYEIDVELRYKPDRGFNYEKKNPTLIIQTIWVA